MKSNYHIMEEKNIENQENQGTELHLVDDENDESDLSNIITMPEYVIKREKLEKENNRGICSNLFHKYILRIENIQKCFTVIFGISCIVLIILLFSVLDPSILPFEIVHVEWKEATDSMTQISICLAFVSFITTNMLILRIFVIISFTANIISIALAPSHLNLIMIMWSFVIILVNFHHMVSIIYNKRPIKIDKLRENVYNNVFKELMTRHDYKILIKNSLIRNIPKGRYYCKSGDICNNLSVLISGQMEVIRDVENDDCMGKNLLVKENEFIDSPEWLMQYTDYGTTFNISISTLENSVIMTWPREVLNEVIHHNDFLKTPLLGILGIDASKKVLLYE